MKYLAFITAILFGTQIYSQPGFNQSHDFGQLAGAFYSLELSHDTVSVYGTVIRESGQGGRLVAQFDTLGTLLHSAVHFDSLGDDFTQVSPNSFIKLSNGAGYAGVGQMFQRRNGYLSVFGPNGRMVSYFEYEDENSATDYYEEVHELDDGFLILGAKQDAATYLLEIFVLKTGFDGSVAWEKKFTTFGRHTLFGQLLVLDENEYVISGSTTSGPGTPLSNTINTSTILAIDSLGNLKWRWDSPASLEEMGAGSIFKTPEGHWAYTSARGEYSAMYNDIFRQPKFVIRDENFNLIRNDTFGVADFPIHHFSKAIELSEGGWLGVGVKPSYYDVPPLSTWYNSVSGWMVRLDDQGDQLWSRVDTAFWSMETGSANFLYDAVELPGGNIIACGYSRTYDPVAKDWGWLIKVNKDGCVDTLNCMPISSGGLPYLPENSVVVYPNPTRSVINFGSETVQQWDQVEVVNTAGQIVRVLKNTRENAIDLSDMQDGIYFLRLIKANRSVTRKIVKRGW